MQLSQHDVIRQIQQRLNQLKWALETGFYDSELHQLNGYLDGVRDAGVIRPEIVCSARSEITSILTAATVKNKLAI